MKRWSYLSALLSLMLATSCSLQGSREFFTPITANSTYQRRLVKSALCESATTTLNKKELLVAEFDVVKDFASDETNNRVCTSYPGTQDNSKLVCIVDFGKADHNLRENCGIYGGIYSESNHTFRCDTKDEEDKNFLVYNEYDVPMCVDASCGQTGWKTYQEEAAASVGSWLEVQGYPNSICKRIRLEPDFATLPNSVPANCPDDTDAIMDIMNDKTTNLTAHRSAKAIGCTSQAGGFNCEIDFSEFEHSFESICESNKGVYLEVDYTLDCDKSGSSLVLTGTNDPFCVSRAFCTPSDYKTESEVRPQSMIGVLSNEGYTCTYKNDLVFEDFVRSLSPTVSASPTTSAAPSDAPSVSFSPTVTYVPSGIPSLLSCDAATSDLMNSNQKVRQALESIQTEIDKVPKSSYCVGDDDQQFCDYNYGAIDHTLDDDCGSEGGTYIEHTMEVICTQPSTGKETVTTYIDRPFCVDERCERVEMNDFLYDYYQSETLPGDTICPSYKLREILFGGRQDVEALEVGEGCKFESDKMSSTIEIVNAKNNIKIDYAEFASKEIKNYCPSKTPGFLDCEFDMSSSSLSIKNNLKTECPNNGGQYLTSAFHTKCYDPQDQVEVTFNVKNVPGCVGYCCSPGESKTLLLAELTWFIAVYEGKGWNCSDLEITSISSPNYNVNSVCVTAAPGTPPTSAPAASPSDNGGGGGGGGGDNDDCEDNPVWGCYEGLNPPLFDKIFTPQSIPTFAPTPTALHSDNFPRPSPGSDDPISTKANDDKLSGGAVAGIIFGVLLVFGLLFYLLYLFVRDKDGDSQAPEEEDLFDDEEKQDRGFDDEDAYEDPDDDDEDDDGDSRSYTTDDWEGDDSRTGDVYTEGNEEDFTIDDEDNEDDGDSYDDSTRVDDDEDDDEYSEGSFVRR